MDKLIELLSEYTHVDFVKYEDGCFKEKYMGEEGRWDSTTEVISKEFGFIKWLVDNDKIDGDKIIEKSDFMPIVSNKVGDFLQPTEEQELLMLLSIQDNPIEFLISVLK